MKPTIISKKDFGNNPKEMLNKDLDLLNIPIDDRID